MSEREIRFPDQSDKSNQPEWTNEAQIELEKATFIQRDGDDEYIVQRLDKPRNRIVLARIGGTKATITKNLAEFQEMLTTEGSPWRVKKA